MSHPFQVALDSGRLVVFMPTLVRDTAAQFRTLLGMLVSAGFKDIVLDGSTMGFLDSLGLAEIVRSYTFCLRSSGSVTLNRLSKTTRDLLEVTRLVTVFTILDVDYSGLQRVEISVDDLGPLLHAGAALNPPYPPSS